MNAVTSDRTLSNLDKPRMDLATMQDLLLKVTDDHKGERSRLLEGHKHMFDRWMLNMWWVVLLEQWAGVLQNEHSSLFNSYIINRWSSNCPYKSWYQVVTYLTCLKTSKDTRNEGNDQIFPSRNNKTKRWLETWNFFTF